jgi:hypothetical protein
MRQPGFRNLWVTIAALACAGTVCAAAAQPPPRRAAPPINGTVVALHGQTLQIMSQQQQIQISVALPEQARIIDQEPASLADVKAGEFIGTTAVQEADGKLHAREIHIFPESMRGTGEGHYPMAGPNTTMTNGNIEAVTGSVAAPAGKGSGSALMLNISYKGGQSAVEVPPNVPVTMMSPGSRSLLKPGAMVTVLSQPNSSGTLTAGAVIVHGHRARG